MLNLILKQFDRPYKRSFCLNQSVSSASGVNITGKDNVASYITNKENNQFNSEEAQKQRSFEQSEREASQAYNSQEAQLSRDFEKSERLSSQSFSSSEAEKNRQFNSTEAQKQRDFEQSIFDQTNEYNSIGSQIQRAKDAGVNPLSVIGNSSEASTVSGSAASSASSPSSSPGSIAQASSSPGSLSSASSANTPSFTNPDLGYIDAASRVLSSVAGAVDRGVHTAPEIKQILANAEKASAGAELDRSTARLNKIRESQYPDELRANMRVLNSQTSLNDTQKEEFIASAKRSYSLTKMAAYEIGLKQFDSVTSMRIDINKYKADLSTSIEKANQEAFNFVCGLRAHGWDKSYFYGSRLNTKVIHSALNTDSSDLSSFGSKSKNFDISNIFGASKDAPDASSGGFEAAKGKGFGLNDEIKLGFGYNSSDSNTLSYGSSSSLSNSTEDNIIGAMTRNSEYYDKFRQIAVCHYILMSGDSPKEIRKEALNRLDQLDESLTNSFQSVQKNADELYEWSQQDVPSTLR